MTRSHERSNLPPERVHDAKVVVWGASGYARVVADILKRIGGCELVGFVDDLEPAVRLLPGFTVPVLGGRECLQGLHNAGVRDLVIAIGECDARMGLAELAIAYGFSLMTTVHPHAVIGSDVSIGSGTVIAAGAIINPGAVLGQNVIINTGATVDHECVIDDGAHIGPGAHLGGRVRVGRAAWLGIGVIVKDRVTIGARAIVGAGAVVLRDVPEAVVAYGVPATVQRRRGPADSLMDRK